MNVTQSRVTVSDARLRTSLSPGLAARFGSGATIAGLSRCPFDGATSYPAEVVEVRLDTGQVVRLFLKDMSSSQLPKEGLETRRRRELAVYRDILARADAGTPWYYGAIADASRDTLSLLLEYVDGIRLERLEFRHWVMAAGWLGRLRGALASREGSVEQCRYLVTQDADFFLAVARLAQDNVDRVSASLGTRLARALRGYDVRVAAVMAQPRALVHGSYRPSNILIDANASPPRVCPIDWELAAWGPALYDFAFLANGCGSPDLDILWDAYGRGAARQGLAVPPLDAVRDQLDSLYLHKVLKSLSESASWNFPHQTVAKLVGLAEQRSCPR